MSSTTPDAHHEEVASWITALENALESHDSAALRGLFVDDSYWRDVVAFTWSIGYVEGRDAIERGLLGLQADVQAREFRISPHRHAPRSILRVGEQVTEGFFTFETTYGHGEGIVRLVPDAKSPVGVAAWVLLTTLQELHGFEALPAGVRRPGQGFSRPDTRFGWAQHREERRSFADREPEVLVVGGGQAGVMTAARLNALGIDNLVIDRNERVGDNWRKRYDSLALHTQTDVVHFPYMPFPDSFPTYIPKDQLANWFESYVESLEISFWTSTEFIGAEYHEDEGRWTARLRGADGTERVLRPQHLVVASGADGGLPLIPDMPGLDAFGGEVFHTSSYTRGEGYSGKKVLVVGAATSAHDTALDLYNYGAEVTMMQRGTTTIIDLDSANIFYAMFVDGTPTDECDLVSAINFTYPLQKRALQAGTKITMERDKELLESLAKVGMRIDQGEDDTGYVMKVHRYGGGYYINVGASEVIARGDIALIQHADFETFVADGIRMKDGSVRQFDVVVLATGFENQQKKVAEWFGEDVAQRVGRISGLDEGFEYSNLHKRTAQEGLWFSGGGLPLTRSYSRYLALQIKAALLGILPGYRESAPTTAEG